MRLSGLLRNGRGRHRLLRRLFKVSAVIVGIFVFLVIGVWLRLRPPVLTVPPQGQLVFTNVTVVNPGLDRRAGQTLTIQDGQIAAITATSSATDAAEANPHFAGSYVLPGLIDMHVHHPPVGAELFWLLYLAHGVTTVHDMGDFTGTILEKRQQLRDGAYPGPRLFACGPFVDGNPPWWPRSRVVRTADEARTTVDELAATGVDCVKVYWRLSGELLVAIREAAARHHLPVVGHVPLAVPFEAAHISDIQHLTGVPVYTYRPEIGRTAQYAAWAAAWRDLDDARIDFIVQTSVAQGLAHTPTLVTWAHTGRLMRDYATLRDAPTARLLPRWYREVQWLPREDFRPIYEGIDAALPKMKAVVRRLHQAGVQIQVGTDTPNPFVVPGAALHEELRHLVDAGFTPEEAWMAATRQPGEALGLSQLGTVQEGAPADVLFFREDPTRDLAALSTLEAVVAQGRLYPKAVLEAALARHHEHVQGWLYDRIAMTFSRWLVSQRPTSEQ